MNDPKGNAARIRIRKHLRKRGDEPVILTERMVLRWWGLLNDAVFYGMLAKPIAIEFVKFKDVHAYAVQEGPRGLVSLRLQPRFSSRRVFLQVLVHEMVHAWEYKHYYRMGHGARFQEWIGRIWWAIRLRLRVKI